MSIPVNIWRARNVRLGVLTLIGVGVAFYVLRIVGVTPIVSAVASVGWRGFAALCIYQIGQLIVLGSAWYVLIPASCGSRMPVFVWARMVRDAASELLPFSHLGGIALGIRAAVARGVPQPTAWGSAVIDITTEMLAQVAFTAVGVAILMLTTSSAALSMPVAGGAALGLLTLVVTCSAFFAFQRYGRHWPIKLMSRLFPRAIPLTDRIVECIQEIYRRPGDVILAVMFHFAGWVASAAGTWIALRLMGVQSSFGPVLAIESLVCAVRSVAFWMPNGLGVQEAAYATIVPLFGIGPEIGLAVSILRRARDIMMGIPILLLWHWTETRQLLAYPPARRQSRAECDSQP